MGNYNQNNIDCSIVIPFYNEDRVVEKVYSRLTKTMNKTRLHYELIFIDDGSIDKTLWQLKEIAKNDSKVVVVELRRNFGQTAAFAAGFDIIRGQTIILMDGDLQHAPEEIPNFLEKIDAGYDVVSGWRKHRVDDLLTRRILSRVASWLSSRISGVDIHDFGITFKAYRREIIEELHLYGDMYRFIPALASHIGAKIIEIPIRNSARIEGVSNYGVSRIFKFTFDLITLRYLMVYITKPLHFFGRVASYFILTSILLISYIIFVKLIYNIPILVIHGPLAGLACTLLFIGLLLISTGLIGELICRVYFESTGNKIYLVRKIYCRESLAREKK